MTIRARLAIALVAAIAVAGALLLAWTAHAQRAGAIAQARDFSLSLHQVTLAGLTSLMIAGAADRRGLFLDQIEHANNIRGLRVLRSPAVDRQFGPGAGSERPSDPLELRVLASGKPEFEVRSEPGAEFLKAVVPALASRDFLGKDCLGCHQAAEGEVLGAVTLEVDLSRTNASIAEFRRDVAIASFGVLLALGMLAYAVASRTVSVPLRRLARNLETIARGRVDLGERLPVRGHDEVAEASSAFNLVFAEAQRIARDESVSADVFEHALEGILVTDRDGIIIKVNPAFSRTTGYSAAEAIGRNPRMLQSGEHDPAFYRRFWDTLTGTGQWQGDIRNRRKNGEVYHEWLTISCVHDVTGEVQNYVAIFSDVTERKRQEALIAHQAQHDGLTGLPNRSLFRDRLVQAMALARRGGEPLAVMFLDLDRFKGINDTYGHAAGDEVLRRFAQRIRGAVRDADTVARISGDEFTVLLPRVQDKESAIAVAAKILEAAREPYLLGTAAVQVTTSIGISLFPAHGDDPELLMKRADQAMYDVKQRGREGCAVFADAVEAVTPA